MSHGQFVARSPIAANRNKLGRQSCEMTLDSTTLYQSHPAAFIHSGVSRASDALSHKTGGIQMDDETRRKDTELSEQLGAEIEGPTKRKMPLRDVVFLAMACVAFVGGC